MTRVKTLRNTLKRKLEEWQHFNSVSAVSLLFTVVVVFAIKTHKNSNLVLSFADKKK